MSMGLGYLIGTVIFAVAVAAQIAAERFRPFLYLFVIVATTTAGTTLADFCDRSGPAMWAGRLSGHASSETALRQFVRRFALFSLD
jgi:uncharacterized membrane-anchored protein